MVRVVIRRAGPRDVPALRLLYTHAFQPTASRDVRRWMTQVPCEVLVAVVDGVVASTVATEHRALLVDGVRIRTGGIAGVATLWEYRGRGLATRLLLEAHQRLRARGVSNASLFTGHNLPAIRIYRRHGYTEESDWVSFQDIAEPVTLLQKRFAYRAKWLSRTPGGKGLLARWRSRAHLITPDWRATIAFDGKKFQVSRGRRGQAALVMRGDSQQVIHCLGDRLTFDRYRRQGRISLRGERSIIVDWRRLLTLEMTE